ncbi:O-acetyl-ADP-ribose deacetylase [Candidatus Latescibacterota bacterium]
MTEYMNGRVTVKTGDITKEAVCAIVNAANSTLMGGGGVDGAIHRAGGPSIKTECKELRETLYPEGLPAGQAAVTTAGNLPAEFVIHTVGPVWRGGNAGEEKMLRECYLNSLYAAREKGCETVAFPAVSTGVYGFPKIKAANIASKAVKEFLEKDDSVSNAAFVFFSEYDAQIFNKYCVFSKKLY